MKNLYKLFSLFALLLVISSCNDKEEFEFVTPDDNFTIVSPSNGASIIIDGENEQNIALTIVWQDNVSNSENYTVEMALNESFEGYTAVGSSSNTTLTLTKEELNAILLANDIPALEETELYFRVTSNNMMSNSIKLIITPFPNENPIITSPETNTLNVVLTDVTEDDIAATFEWIDPDFSENTSVAINYLIEAAVAGTEFATVENLGNTGDRTFELTHGQLNESALNLGLTVDEAGTMDVRVRAELETASGTLERISDFITITVTPYETELPPILYAVGGGLPDAGWSWDSPVEFILQGTVYSGNVNLSPDNGGNFRFFAQQDWGPTSFNYPYYETRGYTIDPNLVNANDGDSNFQFIGTAGQYSLEIDTENKTITLGPPVTGPNCEFDQLWLVGAGVPDAGWGWDTPVEFPCIGGGVYSAEVTLANDAFRFFTTNGDWASGRNYPYYENEGYTIDADFENAGDGDSNFSFIGTPGTYTLTMDTVNKTITIQ